MIVCILKFCSLEHYSRLILINQPLISDLSSLESSSHLPNTISANIPRLPEVGNQREPIYAEVEWPKPGTRCYRLYRAISDPLFLKTPASQRRSTGRAAVVIRLMIAHCRLKVVIFRISCSALSESRIKLFQCCHDFIDRLAVKFCPICFFVGSFIQVSPFP